MKHETVTEIDCTSEPSEHSLLSSEGFIFVLALIGCFFIGRILVKGSF